MLLDSCFTKAGFVPVLRPEPEPSSPQADTVELTAKLFNSGMMHGDFTNLSERKLMDCLNRLGYDIEIKVRPAADPVGHLTLATA